VSDLNEPRERPTSWIRAKPPADVARDALQMARRKQREGCSPCVDAYLDLARENGASEEEIRNALNNLAQD